MSIDHSEKQAITKPVDAHPTTVSAEANGPKISESKAFGNLSKTIGGMSHDQLGEEARKLASSGMDLHHFQDRASRVTGVPEESRERLQKMASLALDLARPGGGKSDVRVYHY